MELETTYGALALIPPLVAIVLSIWKRQVILSLLLGVWIGATIINNYNPLVGLLETFSYYYVERALSDAWNMGILIFCLSIGGMTGVIYKLGGIAAIAEHLVRRAKDSRSTQMATLLLGLAIFFDDYANTIVVGNTMRPVTDKQKISREKLSYIVDSTAATVSSMAPVSTWIAMELGLIAIGLESVGITTNTMIIFFQSVPFRFYSIFALVLVAAIILQKKDYSKMLEAEIRARKKGEVFAKGSKPMFTEDKTLLPDENIKGSVWDAAIPILSFVIITVLGLWYNGYEPGLSIRDAIGNSDASVALVWAAFLSSMIAIIIGVIKKRFNTSEGIDAWVDGTKTMLIAVIILSLAFALKAVISDMELAPWLIWTTQDSLSGNILPALTFVIAFFIAFATGTSWGTNAIIMPIVIPLAAGISGAVDVVTPLMVTTIGAVLTGAVFGDHCSPISDTTILSSMASGSDHVDHVKTQMPYALTAGIVALVFGFIPVGFGVPAWLSLIVGIIAIWLIVKILGKSLDEDGNII